MKSKDTEIGNYIKNIYLPKYFIRITDDCDIEIIFNKKNIMSLVNEKFTIEELSDFIFSHENKIRNLIMLQLAYKILEPTNFTVDELVSIQSCEEPFSDDDIFDIFCEELDKKETDESVLDYCFDYLTKNNYFKNQSRSD